MIRHVRHDDIDKVAWDHRLLRCADKLWYGQSATLDAACPGWDALVDEEGDAQMPLPWRRKWGISYVYQPFLLQRSGPFSVHPEKGDTRRFLAAIPKLFRYVDIQLRIGDGLTDVTERRNVTLDLRSSIGDIRMRYSENLRRNLRRTQEAQEGYDIALDMDELIAFFRGSEQFRRWGITTDQMALMHRVFLTARERGEALIRGVRVAGELVAGAIFIHWGDRLIFLKGIANGRGREARAMPYLLDRIIQEHAGLECTLDMAGSNDPDLARFYLGFGGEQSVYLRATINRLPPIIRMLKA